MNIILEARALSTKSGGVRSYVQNLADHLHAIPDAHVDIVNAERGSAVPLHSELLLPYWLNVQMPSYIRKQQPDVVHFTKAGVPHIKTAPTVVTIFDIIPILLPETQSFFRRAYWPMALKHSALHADKIITISEKSKQDICKYLEVAESKITVTPLAVDTAHYNAQTPTRLAQGKPYILFVGTWDERKNVASLIRAFEMIADTIPHNLVIVGRPAHKDDGSRAYASRSKYAHRIEFRMNVPYDDLPDLYRNADIFVWPSAYEGWGFPPQEAMACGTPVIVSDGGSLPEVVGDAGMVVPFSSETIHSRIGDAEFEARLSVAMTTLIHDTALKQMYRDRGIMQAQKNTWQGVAKATYGVYKELTL